MINKKYSKKDNIGLPGGPNQQFTYVTGVFSQDMYHVPKAEAHKGRTPYKPQKIYSPKAGTWDIQHPKSYYSDNYGRLNPETKKKELLYHIDDFLKYTPDDLKRYKKLRAKGRDYENEKDATNENILFLRKMDAKLDAQENIGDKIKRGRPTSKYMHKTVLDWADKYDAGYNNQYNTAAELTVPFGTGTSSYMLDGLRKLNEQMRGYDVNNLSEQEKQWEKERVESVLKEQSLDIDFRYGGNIPQAQKGLEQPIIYVDSEDDERNQLYQDSFKLYNASLAQKEIFGNGPWVPGVGTIDKTDTKGDLPENSSFAQTELDYDRRNRLNTKTSKYLKNKELIKKYKNLGFTDDTIKYYDTIPEVFNPLINPTSAYLPTPTTPRFIYEKPHTKVVVKPSIGSKKALVKKKQPSYRVHDYMKMEDMDPSFDNRDMWARMLGIKDYKGTGDQNQELIKKLKEYKKNPIRAQRGIDFDYKPRYSLNASESTRVEPIAIPTTADLNSYGDFMLAKRFHKDWMSSPMHMQMLKKSAPDNYLDILKTRSQNINNATLQNRFIKGDQHIPGSLFTGKPAGGYAQGLNYVNQSPLHTSIEQRNMPQIKQYYEYYSDLPAHELSHIQDYKNSLNKFKKLFGSDKYDSVFINLPKSDVSFIRNLKIKDNKLTKEKEKYYSDPTEVRARLNEIRHSAIRNKQWDPFNEKMTPKNLKWLNLDIRKPGALDDLQKIYTDEQIIDLLNTVSQTDDDQIYNNENRTSYAQSGGEFQRLVKKYTTKGWASLNPQEQQFYRETYQRGGDLPSYQLKGSVNQNTFNPDIYGQRALGNTSIDYRDPKLAAMLSAMQAQNRGSSGGVTGMSNTPKKLPRSFIPASESTSTQGPLILTDTEQRNLQYYESASPEVKARIDKRNDDFRGPIASFINNAQNLPGAMWDQQFGMEGNDPTSQARRREYGDYARLLGQMGEGANIPLAAGAYLNTGVNYLKGNVDEAPRLSSILPSGMQDGEQPNIINSLYNDPKYTENNPFSSFAQEMGLGFFGFPKKLAKTAAKNVSKNLLDTQHADELAALKRELEEMRDYTEKNLFDIWDAGANDDLKGISDIYNKNNQRWINTLKKEEREYVNLIQNDSEVQNLISQRTNKEKRLGAKYTKKQRDADINKIYERKRQLLIEEGYDPKITIEDAKRIEKEKMEGYWDLSKTNEDVVYDIQKEKYVADHTGQPWNEDKFIKTEDDVYNEAKHKFETYFRNKNIEENASFAEGLTDYNFQSKMLEQFRKEAMENIPNFEWSKHNDIVKEIAYKKYDEYIKEARKSFESAFKGEPNYSSVDEEVLKYIKEFKQKGGQFNVGDEVDYETMLKLKKLGYEF